MAKKVTKKTKVGRPAVEDELKKSHLVTLRFNDVQLQDFEEVQKFLERTKDNRRNIVKNKISLRDAINYLLAHGWKYYIQDKTRREK